MADEGKSDAKATAKKSSPSVTWDDSQMSTSYANVVNAISSREEFTLFFGTNQTWNAQDSELRVQLSDRVILNPHAAKRLLTLLAAVMKEYENRFGVVNIDLAAAAEAISKQKAS
ncbi:DUF3467 domain-containing protein [Pseudooceanicola sp. MF1-13]|uniref:DUF3467 domain-containing protein n=1 Tax=Pseudooceanicola sp. MF1-13 TaxID=3379095 RepID=UPI0038925B91